MGKGASSGGSKVYNYYGSAAAVVCHGPVDSLDAILADGKEVWTGPLTRGGDPSDDVDVPGRGTLRIYWGTEAQTRGVGAADVLNSAGNDLGHQHPDYLGICYVVLDDWLLGLERPSVPNIEVIVSRKPAQSVITGSAAALDDGQANLGAALAELVTGTRCGLGWASAALDAAAWQAAADTLHAARNTCAASLLLAGRGTLRQIVAELAAMGDLWLRYGAATGLLECGVFQHGTTPGSYATLVDAQLADRPAWEAEGWDQARCGASVAFSDRDRAYKESSEVVWDLRARNALGTDATEALQRPHVTRRDQAIALAQETLRTLGRPQLTATLSVRREHARAIRPGDWVLVDIDPEPNGASLGQFFTVAQRSVPVRGPIELKLEADETLTATPYTASITPATPPAESVPAIAYAWIVEAPPRLVGMPDAVMVLAHRPSALVVGAQVWFDTDSGGAFAELGTQQSFAALLTLRSNVSASATTLPVAGDTTQPDIGRLLEQPGDLGAADDRLLAIVLQPDAVDTGYVGEDGDGYYKLEVCSISATAQVTGGWDLTVLRGRQGTTGRAFTSATAWVWVIPRAGLVGFSHALFEALRNNRRGGTTPAFGQFKLQPYTYFLTRDLDDCSVIGVRFAGKRLGAPEFALTTPGDWAVAISGTYPLSQAVAGTWTDTDANLVSCQAWLVSGADTVQVLDETFAPTGSRAVDFTVGLGTPASYALWLKATDATGLESWRGLLIDASGTGAKCAAPKWFFGPTPLGAETPSLVGPLRTICDTHGAVTEWRMRSKVYGTWSAWSDWVAEASQTPWSRLNLGFAVESLTTMGLEGAHTHSLPSGTTGTASGHSHSIPAATSGMDGSHSHTLLLTQPITPAQVQFEARATKGGFTTSEATLLTIFHTP